jgi:hypothetical protein
LYVSALTDKDRKSMGAANDGTVIIQEARSFKEKRTDVFPCQ